MHHLRLVALSTALLLSAMHCWCPSPRRLNKSSLLGVLRGPRWPVSARQLGEALREGLRDAGYTEGRDVVLDWRFTKGDYAQRPAMAAMSFAPILTLSLSRVRSQ